MKQKMKKEKMESKNENVPCSMLHVSCRSASCFMLHDTCESVSSFKFQVLRGGFALIELLVYIAVLSLALLAIANTLIVITRSYSSVRSIAVVERNAFAFERITREIRGSFGISDADSVFGANPGRLFLNTTDVLGSPRTVLFYIEGISLMLKENGGVAQALTSPDVSVVGLVFRKITTPHSLGVKIELTLESGSGASFHRESLYDTVALRDAN